MRQITGTGQVVLSGTPSQLVAGSVAATGVLIKNTDPSNAVYLGNADVTTTTGAFLGPLESTVYPVQTAIWGVTLGPSVLMTWSMFQSSLPPTQSGGVGTGGSGGSSTVDATIVNTPYVNVVGTLSASVTAGTFDVTVINTPAVTLSAFPFTPYVTVVGGSSSGTVDATIINTPYMTLTSFPFTPDVTISGGTVNASIVGGTFDVTVINTPDVTLSAFPFTPYVIVVGGSSSGTVDATIINTPGVTLTSFDFTPTVLVYGGTVDATILNTPYVNVIGTLSASVTAGTFDVTIINTPFVSLASFNFTPYVTVIGGGSGSSTVDATILNTPNVIISGPNEGGNAPATVAVTTVSTQLLAANANRKGMSILNFSYETMSIAFGQPALIYAGVVLGPGGSVTTDIVDNCTQAVNAVATNVAGGGLASVQEMQ